MGKRVDGSKSHGPVYFAFCFRQESSDRFGSEQKWFDVYAPGLGVRPDRSDQGGSWDSVSEGKPRRLWDRNRDLFY